MIVHPNIEEYLRQLYDDADPIRREMEELARQRQFPIVGPLVGRHLELLGRAIGAKRVFELGSGFGYSALFFARAVGPDGAVHCTDHSEENTRLAENLLGRAGLWPRIVFHCADALETLRQEGGTWDVIFCDIEKKDYPEVVELAHAHLRPGGLFLTDNVLWSGKVLLGEDDGADDVTRRVLEFTRRLFSHKGFLTVIDPTRDGLAVALRL